MRTLGESYIKYVPQTIYGPNVGNSFTVNGPIDNVSYAATMSSGYVNAANEILPVLRLSPAGGNGGYGNSGAAMFLDACTNHGIGGSVSPVAGVSSYLTSGGSGGVGATDHAGGLALLTKNTTDTGPIVRFLVGSSGGFYAINATGGDKGAGTINCTGLYVNGVAVTVP